MNYSAFTSESVASGHPDKIADQISDAILDEVLKKDIDGRVAVETTVTKNRTIVVGEVTTKAKIDFEKVARAKIAELGYVNEEFGYSDKSPVDIFIHKQSADIAIGVDQEGAGDQGIMFGYACWETKELMPMPIILAHRLVEAMDKARESGSVSYLRPDGKSEVKILYENGVVKKLEKVVLAVPWDQRVSKGMLENDLRKKVVLPVIQEYGIDYQGFDLIVNGTGRWEIGGPTSDSGMTGRKIVVDTYGGAGRHGGGCFSGKDPTKVDRSGAYAARFIAKNIVASGFCNRCEVQIAYIIGFREPITFEVETFGTEKASIKKIRKYGQNLLDLSVLGIINSFDLKRPIYSKTAKYGHFGRDGFSWEKIIQ